MAVRAPKMRTSGSSTWTPPPYGFLKINFDGASKGNLGREFLASEEFLPPDGVQGGKNGHVEAQSGRPFMVALTCSDDHL